jgi:competence ComEA-like helix-hairpin-helix protein
MKAEYKFFLYGTLIGVFISGLTIVLVGSNSQHCQASDFSESSTRINPYTSVSSFCLTTNAEIDSETLKLDINFSSLEELTSLPGIGDVKAKSIIDFRKKYGNFISVDELLYVPGIGESLFQQICDLVMVNSKDDE